MNRPRRVTLSFPFETEVPQVPERRTGDDAGGQYLEEEARSFTTEQVVDER
jgi:hypothetical protein